MIDLLAAEKISKAEAKRRCNLIGGALDRGLERYRKKHGIDKAWYSRPWEGEEAP